MLTLRRGVADQLALRIEERVQPVAHVDARHGDVV
jgi:hypothetical protein